jgi:hypothetical protein
MKFSRAISWVRWFSFVETNVSKTISVLVLRVVGLYKTEPPYPADSPRKLHYTHSPGKHQIIYAHAFSSQAFACRLRFVKCVAEKRAIIKTAIINSNTVLVASHVFIPASAGLRA